MWDLRRHRSGGPAAPSARATGRDAPRPGLTAAAPAVTGLLLIGLVALLAGCGALSPRPDDARPGPPGHHATITVPGDAATIQQAVDAAVPGDLVLVDPGVYRESVTVTTPRIVLRGADRDRVVIDGGSRRDTGVTVTAPEVAVENLTVRHHLVQGVAFTGTEDEPLTGYRASYLTVHDNHTHGVLARHARRGLVEHVHASGHSRSGVHIAHCDACRSVVRDTVSGPGGTEAVSLEAADDVTVEPAAP
ncbi:nitrous oxide reductase family maturation protein NosD, partial [Streptomyces sp. SM14]|uniref:right-handed parallel beta-helix repeat-containing protein n=2 Tax=unclassified Streptomyces TaxID=2593676 RepID=UPI0035BC00AB